MKFTFEIDEFNGYYDTVDERDFQKVILENAEQTIVDSIASRITAEYMQRIKMTVEESVKQICKENKAEIIEKIVERVTDKIMTQKKIKEQMPKKSELNDIDKEWEKYFIILIDKAIAKRFK